MAISIPYKYGLRNAAMGTAITLTTIAGSPRPSPASSDESIRNLVRIPRPKGTEAIRAEGVLGDTLPMQGLVPPSAIGKDSSATSAGDIRSDFAVLFERLVKEWKATRNPTQMSARMVANPAYQSIIRMRGDAIPLILAELKREPDEWFYALAKITGENPVTDACRGRFPQMVETWIRWGKENGYIVG